MTGCIFHSVTIKSSSPGIFRKDRCYNNTVPLFSCTVSIHPRTECSYSLSVITEMPSPVTCSIAQGCTIFPEVGSKELLLTGFQKNLT